MRRQIPVLFEIERQLHTLYVNTVMLMCSHIERNVLNRSTYRGREILETEVVHTKKLNPRLFSRKSYSFRHKQTKWTLYCAISQLEDRFI
jgi:hypothetical protein